jgi:hypothetical protein
VGRGIHSAVHGAAGSSLAQRLGRIGFQAKALVYGVVAVLALRAALGLRGGRTTDTRGAIAEIAEGRFGTALVMLLAVAFAGLGAWFVLDGATDPLRHRRGRFGFVTRTGQAFGGFGYLALAVWAAQHALGNERATSSNALTQSWTARALELPLGPLLVAMAGAVVLVVGLRQVWIGASHGFEASLDLSGMHPFVRHWAKTLGLLGFCTQGAVFGAVGTFLVQAAIQNDAREATGFDGALAWLARQMYGKAMLVTAAVGLLAYAAFAMIEGACKRMERVGPPPPGDTPPSSALQESGETGRGERGLLSAEFPGGKDEDALERDP